MGSFDRSKKGAVKVITPPPPLKKKKKSGQAASSHQYFCPSNCMKPNMKQKQ